MDSWLIYKLHQIVQYNMKYLHCINWLLKYSFMHMIKYHFKFYLLYYNKINIMKYITISLVKYYSKHYFLQYNMMYLQEYYLRQYNKLHLMDTVIAMNTVNKNRNQMLNFFDKKLIHYLMYNLTKYNNKSDAIAFGTIWYMYQKSKITLAVSIMTVTMFASIYFLYLEIPTSIDKLGKEALKQCRNELKIWKKTNGKKGCYDENKKYVSAHHANLLVSIYMTKLSLACMLTLMKMKM